MSEIYLHERIAMETVREIKSGDLRPGDPLPEIKAWMRRYDCGYHTVRQARLLLKRKQYVERYGGTLHVTSFAPFI